MSHSKKCITLFWSFFPWVLRKMCFEMTAQYTWLHVTCEVEISPASSSSIFTLQRFGRFFFVFFFPHNTTKTIDVSVSGLLHLCHILPAKNVICESSLKYGFCKKLLWYKWTSDQFNTFVFTFCPDQCWSGQKVKTKVLNWSEVHLYRSNFLQNPYFSTQCSNPSWAELT